MPTVVCDRKDCVKRGIEVCTAGRVYLVDGECQSFESIGELMRKGNKPNCHKENGKYRSDRVRVLR